MSRAADAERQAGKRAIAGAFAELRGSDPGRARAARAWLTGRSAELAFAASLVGLSAESVRRAAQAMDPDHGPGSSATLLRRLRALQCPDAAG